MRFIKLSTTIFASALFSMSCNLFQTDQTADTDPYPNDVQQAEIVSDNNDYYARARENLDLQAIGPLLERAGSAQELEYLINSDRRINNLDLNQDGYVDYISVAEFDDRDDDERGLSLFSRFGPDLIQEITTIIFNRGGRNASGARILLTGNEQLYGDNYYYETNWIDRALPIVNYLFSDRNTSYNSPYYHGNYPDNYEVYEVVETPVYRNRIEQVYAEPVFIQTSSPTITQTKIRSPYEGKTVSKVFSKPGKLTKEEKEFRKNNSYPPEFVPGKKGKMKDVSFKPEKEPKGNPNNFERAPKVKKEKPEKREKPDKIYREESKLPKAEKQNMKPPKAENPGRGKGGGNKPGRGNEGNEGGKGKGGDKGGGGKGGGKKN